MEKFLKMHRIQQSLRVEVPEFRRCCCCIPLRYGLLSFVYAKLVLSLLYAILLVYITVQSFFLPGWFVLFVSIGISSCLADIGFSITFIVGAHKKNQKLLTVYYYFALSTIGVITVIFLLVMGMYIYIYYNFSHDRNPLRKIIFVESLSYGITVAVQVYLILLIRSEILKLKRNCKFEFLNNAADAEAGAECHLDVNATLTSKE